MSGPVSVVVPTRDRAQALRSCLEALAAQTVEDLEVVVVDDGSSDAAAVSAQVDAVGCARLLRGGGRGPAAARNLGARAATGEMICFTDDDCRPEPNWVAGLVATVADGADAAAGPTRAPAGAGPVVRAAQLVASHLAEATADVTTGRMVFAPTSNLACRADAHAVVPFDEHYPLAAGEDRDWCTRLRATGRELVFAPDAVVRHHQELTLRSFWRQQLRYGRGGWRYHRAQAHESFEQPGWYLDLLTTGLRDGAGVGALVGLAQVATAVGMAWEAFADARARLGSCAEREHPPI